MADDQLFDSVAELRVVELGPHSGANVLVKSGLEAGEQLIVRGQRGLVDGALVDTVATHDSIETMRRVGRRLGTDSESDDSSSEASQAPDAGSD